MRRREFITLLGAAATSSPLAAYAQHPDGMRRIGVLMGYPESDAEAQAYFAIFRDSLRRLGWIERRNIRIDTRWTIPSDADSMQRFAKELIAQQPEVILSNTTPTTAALTGRRCVPRIFDPVGWFSTRLLRRSAMLTSPSVPLVALGEIYTDFRCDRRGWRQVVARRRRVLLSRHQHRCI